MRFFVFRILFPLIFLASCDNTNTVVEVIDGSTVLLNDGTQVNLIDVAKTEQNKNRLLETILDKEIYLFDSSKNPITSSGVNAVTAYLYYGDGTCINNQLSKIADNQADKIEPKRTDSQSPTLAKLYNQTKSAIFFVYTADDSTVHQGSGFFINSDGTGISNFHVFNGTRRGVEIIKTEDGAEYHIREVLAQSAELDYIIFKIENAARKNHSFVRLASTLPLIGENVYSIGNPRGLEKTLSTGIISGYRNGSELIQTTSEITNGSSGGALFNMKGDVVGITTSGLGEANLNFAVNIEKIPAREFSYRHPEKLANSLLTVTKIVDGDTFYVNNNNGEIEKIRLIGVNAPESRAAFFKKKERFGRESKEYLTKILYGRKVRLETDLRKYDQYGRTLAYVYLEDGTFLNNKMLKDGFAQVMTVPPNVKYQGLFVESERLARYGGFGLWK